MVGEAATLLGIVFDEGPRPARYAVSDLVQAAVRVNARRAHLLVSTVLGKHIPTDPDTVYDMGIELGGLVGECLTGAHPTPADAPLVIGYAETATALGATVADALGAVYLHSTRRRVPGIKAVAGFEEEHSHATGHLLLPSDDAMMTGSGPLILVDDELSTGQTALNTISVLQEHFPREHYIVASLVDVRAPADRERLAAFALQHEISLDVVALAQGAAVLPDDLGSRARQLALDTRGLVPVVPATDAAIVRVPSRWPADVPDGGRHGTTAAQRTAARAAALACARQLPQDCLGARVLVLATEELMYAPLLIARALSAQSHGRREVLFSSTTRSPVVDVDRAGYPVRSRLEFASHDTPADGPGRRFAYNVIQTDPSAAFTDIVVVVDDVADTPQLAGPDGLLRALASTGAHVVVLVIPSYQPATALESR